MTDDYPDAGALLPRRSKLVYHVMTPIVFVLLVLLGWYVVVHQGEVLSRSAISSFQETELEIARATARGMEQYTAAPDHPDLEQELFSRFVAPIHLLKSGGAWLCLPDGVLFDPDDGYFPTGREDRNIATLFAARRQYGAEHYEELLEAISTGQEGTGWYVWSSGRGREIAAWAPVQIGAHRGTIVVATPLTEILDATGATGHALASAIALPLVTLISAVVILLWRRTAMQQWLMYRMLYRRERFLNLLNDITWTALSQSDNQETMHTLAGRLSELYEADGCCLIYWDETTERAGPVVRCGESNSNQTCSGDDPREGDIALALAVLDRRQPLALEEIADTFYADSGIVRAEDIHSLLGLPLIAGTRKIGVLIIGWRRPRKFSEQEVAWAGLVARHIALAIDKNRLLSNARRQARELALLHDVSLAAASNVRLGDTLTAAAKALAVEWQATLVSLMLIDENGEKLDIVASVGYPDDFLDRYPSIPLGEGITGWVAQYGEPILLADVRHDPRYIAGSPDVRSELCVPLLAGNEVIGVLNVESTQPNAFSLKDQQLLTTLAGNLVVLLQRARLFEALMAAQEELRQQAQALQEYAAALEARNEELDAFAHTVAHDLKASLSFVVGYAEVLGQEHATMPPEQRLRVINSISQAGYKMADVIEELMLLAGLRRAEVLPGPVLMAHVVSEACARLQAFIEAHQAELVIPETWPLVLGYGPWLEEVWVNYISNAIKYGGRPPRVELGADLLPDGRVRFWVRDNGAGVTPEMLGRLFSSSPHLSQVRFGGHGLGLSIVRRIIERLNGEVGVESVIGRGSTFYFILPGVPK